MKDRERMTVTELNGTMVKVIPASRSQVQVTLTS
jgi:hypothetical protein